MANPPPPSTPRVPAFRFWLVDALEATELTPAAISRGIGAGVNSVGAFLREPGRDITLSRAADIERFVRKDAKLKGVALKPICRALAVPGVSDA